MRTWHHLLLPLVLLAVLGGCAYPSLPILPAAATDAETSGSASPSEAPGDVPALAGRWQGDLSIAALNLEIILTFAAEEGVFSGAIDIPQQGASGLPLNQIELNTESDPPTVRFTMLDGPNQGVFQAELTANALEGTFTQAGMEGVFSLNRADGADKSSAPTATPAAGDTAGETADAANLVNRWSGDLAIAGLNLQIVLIFTDEEGALQGTIDIPEQGATGLPLHDIVYDAESAPPTVRFEMLEGAQLGVFDGVIRGETLGGTFSQGGLQGTFSVAVEDRSTGVESGAIYSDPAGHYSVPVPTNWTVSETDDYAVLRSPDDGIEFFVMVMPGEVITDAVDAAWQIIDPAFNLRVGQVVAEPNPDVEQALSYIYDTENADARLIVASGQRRQGLIYVQILRGQITEIQKRAAQVQIIGSGFSYAGVEKDDLTGATARPLDAELLAEVEAYIVERMAFFDIPGAAVAIVQGGEIRYSQGFGSHGADDPRAIGPDTQMMIGSSGKTMTTLLMATLVDDGLLDWDQRVVSILPDFAVQDPELSQEITVQNLVCACTGVPRRDVELVFNANDQDAEDVVTDLQSYEIFTDFGEAFQYSNQMVATGGYVAAAAAGGEWGNLMAAYAEALEERVIEPIGMTDTTVSFEEVLARGNYAHPHGINLANTFYPLALDVEKLLLPVAPAGGAHWSTVSDMARYLITELNVGVAPDGRRMVSEKNLRKTWEPQIPVGAETSYGLGWFVDSYKGLPFFHHGGNTFGFTSEMAFLPDADLGMIVLTNGRATNLFNFGVIYRVLELTYDQPFEAEERIDFQWQQIQRQMTEIAEEITATIDADGVAPLLGAWTNEALGPIELSLNDGVLLLDAGDFISVLHRQIDEPQEYVLFDMPLAGLGLRLQTDDGVERLLLGSGVVEYEFTRVE